MVVRVLRNVNGSDNCPIGITLYSSLCQRQDATDNTDRRHQKDPQNGAGIANKDGCCCSLLPGAAPTRRRPSLTRRARSCWDICTCSGRKTRTCNRSGRRRRSFAIYGAITAETARLGVAFIRLVVYTHCKGKFGSYHEHVSRCKSIYIRATLQGSHEATRPYVPV